MMHMLNSNAKSGHHKYFPSNATVIDSECVTMEFYTRINAPQLSWVCDYGILHENKCPTTLIVLRTIAKSKDVQSNNKLIKNVSGHHPTIRACAAMWSSSYTVEATPCCYMSNNHGNSRRLDVIIHHRVVYRRWIPCSAWRRHRYTHYDGIEASKIPPLDSMVCVCHTCCWWRDRFTKVSKSK